MFTNSLMCFVAQDKKGKSYILRQKFYWNRDKRQLTPVYYISDDPNEPLDTYVVVKFDEFNAVLNKVREQIRKQNDDFVINNAFFTDKVSREMEERFKKRHQAKSF